jgi:hypothetical protein
MTEKGDEGLADEGRKVVSDVLERGEGLGHHPEDEDVRSQG